jgi:sulfane dehydrogenase subunit SoxC
MSRSVPLKKIMDDAIVALYQNGERLRPENGYPLRLFLPGYEGNMSVKWLRRLKVVTEPTMTRDETSHYTDVLLNGKALILTYPMEVKSIGRCRALRSRAAEVVHSIQDGVALERRTGRADEPRDR